MFAERLGGLPAHLGDFVAAPEPWATLSREVQSALVAAGEAALAQDCPALTATAYLAYTRTGDRTGFEDGYFARRRLLNALVLAECVEGQARFLDRIADG